MNRRRFLAIYSAALLSLAGCETPLKPDADQPESFAISSHTERPRDISTKTSTTGGDPLPIAKKGKPSDICSMEYGTKANIQAITAPASGKDWDDVQITDYGTLTSDSVIVGLRRDGLARAYPLSILWEHEIVNDELADPVLITYCSRCYSAMVANRSINGKPRQFGVSGLLWRPPKSEFQQNFIKSNLVGASRGKGDTDRSIERDWGLVMYDSQTGSYWSQLLARCICGQDRGESLPLIPAETTTWGEWQQTHPETDVLLPPPHSLPLNPPYIGETTPGL